jgi:hypothetical protein
MKPSALPAGFVSEKVKSPTLSCLDLQRAHVGQELAVGFGLA